MTRNSKVRAVIGWRAYSSSRSPLPKSDLQEAIWEAEETLRGKDDPDRCGGRGRTKRTVKRRAEAGRHTSVTAGMKCEMGQQGSADNRRDEKRVGSRAREMDTGRIKTCPASLGGAPRWSNHTKNSTTANHQIHPGCPCP